MAYPLLRKHAFAAPNFHILSLCSHLKRSKILCRIIVAKYYTEGFKMEFVPYRVLRNQPSELRRKLDEQGELVVTVDGVPMAVMLQIPKGSLEDLVMLLSQVRAQLAVATIREQARKDGLNKMTVQQANALVKETRTARRGG
jgi:hypothetical protein